MPEDLKRSRKLMKDALKKYPFLRNEPDSVRRHIRNMAKCDASSLHRFPASFVFQEWLGISESKPAMIKYLLGLSKTLGEDSLSDPFIRKTVETLLPSGVIPSEEKTKYIKFVGTYLKNRPDAFCQFPQDVRTDMVLDVCNVGHLLYYDTTVWSFWSKVLPVYGAIAPELSFAVTSEELVSTSFELMKRYLKKSRLICCQAARMQALVAYHSGKVGYRVVDIPPQKSNPPGHVAGEFILPDGRIKFVDALWGNEDPKEYGRRYPETFGNFETQIFKVTMHSNGSQQTLRFSGPQYLRRLENSKYY